MRKFCSGCTNSLGVDQAFIKLHIQYVIAVLLGHILERRLSGQNRLPKVPPRPSRAGLPADHEKLFPEISFRPQPALCGAGDIARERTQTPRQERTPGNTTRKVYLWRAQAKELKQGDILMFYLSIGGWQHSNR